MLEKWKQKPLAAKLPANDHRAIWSQFWDSDGVQNGCLCLSSILILWWKWTSEDTDQRTLRCCKLKICVTVNPWAVVTDWLPISPTSSSLQCKFFCYFASRCVLWSRLRDTSFKPQDPTWAWSGCLPLYLFSLYSLLIEILIFTLA